MAQLLLGPVLRHLDTRDATIWVQTDAACTVSVLGHEARTFAVEGHHFALVVVEGLRPGTVTPYEVHLDGERRWPEPGSPFPPSTIRTPGEDEAVRLAFGSCRVSVPHEPPWTLRKDQDPRGRELDALYALALRLPEEPIETWPTRLLLLGDQVYADEVSPQTAAFIRARRDTRRPPGEQVADFEEYARLYLEAWGEPVLRWLLSTVATAMIFDDHDVHDDWNISAAWVRDMRRLDWWQARITGAFMSYWVFQHLGNLTPEGLAEERLLARVRAADGDAAPLLREAAAEADRASEGARWSYARDMGTTRLVVIDSRAGRVLRGDERTMVDPGEWDWVCEQLVGGPEHLVIGTTLPVLLGHGVHFLEAWSEAVCAGAWGATAARLGERLRRALDLEHWAAFGTSFAVLVDRLREVAAGEHGPPPKTITLLSGDVHHAYLSAVAFRRDAGARSHVWQAVCSPFRNPLDAREQRVIRFGHSRTGHAVARLAARAAGVRDPEIRWRMVRGPYFDNQVGVLELDGDHARMVLRRTQPGDPDGRPRLHECFAHDLGRAP